MASRHRQTDSSDLLIELTFSLNFWEVDKQRLTTQLKKTRGSRRNAPAQREARLISFITTTHAHCAGAPQSQPSKRFA